MIIYKITNKLNGKLYIGQTTNKLTIRWNSHCSNRKKSGISEAIKKYGKENFTIEEIDGANSLSELNYLEEHYIHIYNTIAPFGYNLVPGGKNFNHTEATRIKMRKPKTFTNGKPRVCHSLETRRKISEALKGRKSNRIYNTNKKKRSPLTQEHKLAISKRNKGHKHNKGRKHTQEFKDNCSKRQKGKKLSPDHIATLRKVRKGFDSPARKQARDKVSELNKIKVIAEEIETGNISIFNSLKEASEYTKVHSGNISKIINGIILKSKGWTFKVYE